MDDEDLAELIAQVKAGNADAIHDLIVRFQSDLRMSVRERLPQKLRSRFDSLDFVQKVWQSVLTTEGQDLGRFTNAQHFRGFLAGVARNKVLEEYRRQTRTRKYNLQREEPLYVRHGDRERPRELPAPGPTPSQDVQADDRLAQLIKGRSEQEAKVVQLRRQGLTFEEIARQVGVDERSVRRIIDAIRVRMEARKWQ